MFLTSQSSSLRKRDFFSDGIVIALSNIKWGSSPLKGYEKVGVSVRMVFYLAP